MHQMVEPLAQLHAAAEREGGADTFLPGRAGPGCSVHSGGNRGYSGLKYRSAERHGIKPKRDIGGERWGWVDQKRRKGPGMAGTRGKVWQLRWQEGEVG